MVAQAYFGFQVEQWIANEKEYREQMKREGKKRAIEAQINSKKGR